MFNGGHLSPPGREMVFLVVTRQTGKTTLLHEDGILILPASQFIHRLGPGDLF